ncbi:MAG: hypothetical protein ACHREM_12265 [Polyangiales bacterium]
MDRSTRAPNTKGTNFQSLRAFVVDKAGSEGWQRVLDSMSPEDREIVASVLAMSWTPTELYLRAADAAAAEFASTIPNFRYAMGRAAAEHDLTLIHRAFLRLANPAFVLEKSTEYWSRFHDQGRWVITRLPNGAIATLEDWVADEGFCTTLGAYITRMFELVGARDVHFEHTKCRVKGHSSCVFNGHWR